VPDLHGWITQQIDEAEQQAREGLPVLDDEGRYLLTENLPNPAAVLRRRTADRRILARHRLNPDATWYEAAMCDGCGTEGEMAYPVTENLNDCPELLDLAYAHGLTDEVLATLDRPQEGERPERTGPSLIPDAFAEAFGKSMLAALTTQIIAANTPSPTEKAIRILAPELKKIPGYVPTPTDGHS
jgi:hypothetical protein